MKIGTKGLDLIKEFEGYHKKLSNGSCVAYLDTLAGKKHWSPGYRGLWTIGYGCTEGVYDGLVWTEKQATQALLREVAKHEGYVNDYLKRYQIQADQNQFDALVSFSYNLGPKNVEKIVRYWNEKGEEYASNKILDFNKAGGKVYKGLVRRRKAEKDLFDSYTDRQIVQASRKLSWLSRARLALASVGAALFSAETLDVLDRVKDWALDNSWLLIGASLGVSWLVFKWIEAMSIQDHHNGRYQPSGAQEEDVSLVD